MPGSAGLGLGATPPLLLDRLLSIASLPRATKPCRPQSSTATSARFRVRCPAVTAIRSVVKTPVCSMSDVRDAPRQLPRHAPVLHHQMVMPGGQCGTGAVEKCSPMKVNRCAIGQPQPPGDHMVLKPAKSQPRAHHPLGRAHGLAGIRQTRMQPIAGAMPGHRVPPRKLMVVPHLN